MVLGVRAGARRRLIRALVLGGLEVRERLDLHRVGAGARSCSCSHKRRADDRGRGEDRRGVPERAGEPVNRGVRSQVVDAVVARDVVSRRGGCDRAEDGDPDRRADPGRLGISDPRLLRPFVVLAEELQFGRLNLFAQTN